MIEKHIREAIEDEIALHILLIAEKIEKTVGTLLKKTEIYKIGNANYAQTAHQGITAPKIKYL